MIDAPIAFERVDVPRDSMAKALAGIAIAEAAAIMPDSILMNDALEFVAFRKLAPTIHPESARVTVQPGGTMPMLTLTTTHPDSSVSSIALLNCEQAAAVGLPDAEEQASTDQIGRRHILAMTTTLRVTLQAAINSEVSAASARRRAENRRVLDAVADAALPHVPDGHGIDVLAATPWAPASIRSRSQGVVTELPETAIPGIDAPAILARFPMIDVGTSQASGTALYIGPGDACRPGTDDPIERMRRARRADKAITFLRTLA